MDVIAEKTVYRNIKLNYIYTICLFSWPIFDIYKSIIPGLSVGKLFMAIILVICLLVQCKNKYIKIEKNVYCIGAAFVVLILSSVIACGVVEKFDLIKMIGRIGFLGFYFVIWVVGNNIIDFKIARNCLRFWGTIAIIIVIIQLLAYEISGLKLSFYFPGLETEIENLRNTFVLIANGDTFILRPRSIFNEPAHFATYVSLALAVEFFGAKGKLNWKWIGWFTLGLVISISGSGVYFMIVIWGWYILCSKKKNIWLGVGIGGITACLMLFLLGKWQMIYYSLSRLTISSGRMTSFFKAFAEFDSVGEYLFGCGIGNTMTFFAESSVFETSSFMSGMGRFFVEGGLVSGMFFLFSLLMLLLLVKKERKIFVILFILFNLIDVAAFGMYLPLYLVWTSANEKELVMREKGKW